MTRRPLSESVDSGDMSNEGGQVRARRERLGYDKKRLATEAGVSRETLYAIERGEGFRQSSLAKINRVLDAAEEEAGIGAPPAVAQPPEGELMEIRAEGVYGIQSIVINGPVRDRDELVETIAKLIERVRREER